jgi:hypothetical protein
MHIILATLEVESIEWRFNPSLDKTLARSYLRNKLGMVAHTCVSKYLGDTGRKIRV